MTADEYISNRLEEQIDWYDRKSVWNQKWFKRMQIYQIFAAALIPVLIGSMHDTEGYVKTVVAFLGASIAIATGVLGLFKFQENWLAYRTTCETLRHEKFLYLTCSEPYNGIDPFLLLVSRVEFIISRENSSWSESMRQKKSERQDESCRSEDSVS